jgi:hypothetical protein
MLCVVNSDRSEFLSPEVAGGGEGVGDADDDDELKGEKGDFCVRV